MCLARGIYDGRILEPCAIRQSHVCCFFTQPTEQEIQFYVQSVCGGIVSLIMYFFHKTATTIISWWKTFPTRNSSRFHATRLVRVAFFFAKISCKTYVFLFSRSSNLRRLFCLYVIICVL